MPLYQQRLKKNETEKGSFLDLSSCGLSGEEPFFSKLAVQSHIKALSFEEAWPFFCSDGRMDMFLSQEQERAAKNRFRSLPKGLPQNLESLVFRFDRAYLEPRAWLFFVQQLKGLGSLNLYSSRFYSFDLRRALAQAQSQEEEEPLAFLQYLPALEELHLDSSDIRSTKSLTCCTNLRKLNMGYTQPDDVDFFRALKKLKMLNLRACSLEDLSILAECKELAYLELAGNPLRKYHFLRELPLLRFLSLEQVEEPLRPFDLRLLRNMQDLAYLDLKGQPLSFVEELLALPSLRELFIDARICEQQANRKLFLALAKRVKLHIS